MKFWMRAFFVPGNLQKKISRDYEMSETEPPKIEERTAYS